MVRIFVKLKRFEMLHLQCIIEQFQVLPLIYFYIMQFRVEIHRRKCIYIGGQSNNQKHLTFSELITLPSRWHESIGRDVRWYSNFFPRQLFSWHFNNNLSQSSASPSYGSDRVIMSGMWAVHFNWRLQKKIITKNYSLKTMLLVLPDRVAKL